MFLASYTQISVAICRPSVCQSRVGVVMGSLFAKETAVVTWRWGRQGRAEIDCGSLNNRSGRVILTRPTVVTYSESTCVSLAFEFPFIVELAVCVVALGWLVSYLV